MKIKMGGFQDRTGTTNKITTIREQFGECFERLGGIDALEQFGRENPKLFYNMYSKMAEKSLKIETRDRTHEAFIELMLNKQQQRIESKGQPVSLLEVVKAKEKELDRT